MSRSTKPAKTTKTTKSAATTTAKANTDAKKLLAIRSGLKAGGGHSCYWVGVRCGC